MVLLVENINLLVPQLVLRIPTSLSELLITTVDSPKNESQKTSYFIMH